MKPSRKSWITAVASWVACIAFMAKSSAAVEWPEPSYVTAEQASYRIRVPNGNCGSGTGIDPYVCVTNAHVIGRTHQRDIAIEHGPTGQRWLGWSFVLDPNRDLALIWVDEGNLPCVQLGDDIDEQTQYTILGYPKAGDLQSGRGSVIDWVGSQGNRSAQLSVMSIVGDSGGGIFDDQDRLVGVTWGSDAETTAATARPAKYIRDIVARWRQNTNVKQTQWGYWDRLCPGGSCERQGGLSIGIGAGISRRQIVRRQPSRGATQRPDVPGGGPQGEQGPAGPPGESFIEWFAREEGDQDGDGEITKNDVRIAYRGAPGEDGQDGSPGMVDLDEIRRMVREEMPELDEDRLADYVIDKIPPIYIDGERPREIRPGDRLPPFYVRKGVDGEVTSEEQVHLGEGITFWEYPHGADD